MAALRARCPPTSETENGLSMSMTMSEAELRAGMYASGPMRRARAVPVTRLPG